MQLIERGGIKGGPLITTDEQANARLEAVRNAHEAVAAARRSKADAAQETPTAAPKEGAEGGGRGRGGRGPARSRRSGRLPRIERAEQERSRKTAQMVKVPRGQVTCPNSLKPARDSGRAAPLVGTAEDALRGDCGAEARAAEAPGIATGGVEALKKLRISNSTVFEEQLRPAPTEPGAAWPRSRRQLERRRAPLPSSPSGPAGREEAARCVRPTRAPGHERAASCDGLSGSEARVAQEPSGAAELAAHAVDLGCPELAEAAEVFAQRHHHRDRAGETHAGRARAGPIKCGGPTTSRGVEAWS